ncbi:MAG: hypothetical protein LBK45_03620 [Tannerellaceae bacterium]|jgi:hypothetical protein|nr:hypothetical protein [Tannerellaceae bacterium]
MKLKVLFFNEQTELIAPLAEEVLGKIASFFLLFLLSMTLSCGSECCWDPGRDTIILSVVDSEGHDLLDMNSEPHYLYYHIKVYYVDKEGNKKEFRNLNNSYGFREEYNKYALVIDLHPEQAQSEKSTLIIEWEAGEKPDTLVTLWNKDLETWREIYMNGELLEAEGEGYTYKYVEYVKDK